MGGGDLTVTAGTTDHAAVTGSGVAVLSSVVSTTAGIRSGAPTALGGNLVLAATQDASGSATGSGAALTATRHSVDTVLDRDLTVAGSASLTSSGQSVSSSFSAARMPFAPVSAGTATKARTSSTLDTAFAADAALGGTAGLPGVRVADGRAPPARSPWSTPA